MINSNTSRAKIFLRNRALFVTSVKLRVGKLIKFVNTSEFISYICTGKFSIYIVFNV